MGVLVALNGVLYQYLVASVTLYSVVQTRNVFVVPHATTKLLGHCRAPSQLLATMLGYGSLDGGENTTMQHPGV